MTSGDVLALVLQNANTLVSTLANGTGRACLQKKRVKNVLARKKNLASKPESCTNI
jgi:hypothetical protein